MSAGFYDLLLSGCCLGHVLRPCEKAFRVMSVIFVDFGTRFPENPSTIVLAQVQLFRVVIFTVPPLDPCKLCTLGAFFMYVLCTPKYVKYVRRWAV